MKTLKEYLEDVNKGIKPPDYIPNGGEDSCDVCGGAVEWPPTGEPCQGVCLDNCAERIRKAYKARNALEAPTAVS